MLAKLSEGIGVMLLRDVNSPPVIFAMPWHAELFAITVYLHNEGLFCWADWTARFSDALRRADEHHSPDGSNGYYDVWLDTFAQFMAELGVTDKKAIDALSEKWREAYLHTPHGMPVTLIEEI